jgi:hypothetical protein
MVTTIERPTIVADAIPHVDPAPAAAPIIVAPRRRTFWRWLLQDSPYITMLVLALVGVTFHVAVQYWVVLTPVFCVMCIIAGWRHFDTRGSHLRLVISMVLSWGALMLAIYVLKNNGVEGVLTATANELAMLTLLALGTFVAGVQAQVWRICAVGGVLFLAVPGIGWLDQSVMLLAAATLLIIAVGGLVWWVEQRPRKIAA